MQPSTVISMVEAGRSSCQPWRCVEVTTHLSIIYTSRASTPFTARRSPVRIVESLRVSNHCGCICAGVLTGKVVGVEAAKAWREVGAANAPAALREVLSS